MIHIPTSWVNTSKSVQKLIFTDLQIKSESLPVSSKKFNLATIRLGYYSIKFYIIRIILILETFQLRYNTFNQSNHEYSDKHFRFLLYILLNQNLKALTITLNHLQYSERKEFENEETAFRKS